MTQDKQEIIEQMKLNDGYFRFAGKCRLCGGIHIEELEANRSHKSSIEFIDKYMPRMLFNGPCEHCGCLAIFDVVALSSPPVDSK